MDVIALYTLCFTLLARGDECRRLLRTGGAAARLRRLRAVLHQRGHGVRSARLGRALHPVQVHQDARTEGTLTSDERSQNTHSHHVSDIPFFIW